MSHDPSRKHFLARILGFAAAGALAPRSVARAVAPAPDNKAGGPAAPFLLRREPRAVARRGGAA
ncbi:MAG: hypothetical protein ABSH26_08695 [Opitutaceae bacterium]